MCNLTLNNDWTEGAKVLCSLYFLCVEKKTQKEWV
jgi:hypothetical protein